MLQSPTTPPLIKDIKVVIPPSSTPIPTHNNSDVKRKEQLVSNRLSSTTTTIITPPSTPTPQQQQQQQPFFFTNNNIRNQSFSSLQHSFDSQQQQQLFLDHSHLKPGQNASLLSYSKTINMYRENAKKTNNMEIQCDFAIFLVEAAKRLLQQQQQQKSTNSTTTSSSSSSSSSNSSTTIATTEEDDDVDNNQQQAYLLEAEKILKQIAMRGHSESQYYLANMYAAGLLNKTGKPDFDKSFPLFVQSAKHHHPDAAYRTAKCYEDGLGTRRDKAKAVQYYRKAATLNHPGAMYRLGLAEMKGELTLSRNIRDGHKWLKRSAEAATPQYPHALHELGLLHERGVESIIFIDLKYAVTLYHEASILGYAPSAYRLGECYEFGRLDCSIDANLSIQYYTIAAEQHHPESCFALTAWYLVGVQDILPPSDEQAYHWAMCAAQAGLPRAEYAVGYFSEMGIGTEKDLKLALDWYQRAADHGEKRAIQRLGNTTTTATKKKKTSLPTKRLSFMSISSSQQQQQSHGGFLYRATSFLRKQQQKN